jgi:superfamily II DNA/RNA helicase
MGKKNKKNNGEAAPQETSESQNGPGDASVPNEASKKKKRSPLSPPPTGSFRTIQPPLSQGVLDFLDSKNFHTMTPVQEATIPLFLTNKDVAVQAVTGKRILVNVYSAFVTSNSNISSQVLEKRLPS